MKKNTHLVEINTQDGTLNLDGVSIADITTSCAVSLEHPGPARVKLSLLADVIVHGDATVMIKTSQQGRSAK